MRKNVAEQPKHSKDDKEFIDLSHVYLSYNTEGLAEPVQQRSKTARPKTSRASGVPRYYHRPNN
jgi:kinesin family protein 3/17